MSYPEAHDVGIFCDSAFMSVKCRDLTLEKAKAFAGAYNNGHHGDYRRDTSGRPPVGSPSAVAIDARKCFDGDRNALPHERKSRDCNSVCLTPVGLTQSPNFVLAGAC